MPIRERISDAQILFANRRFHGCLLLLLIAVAAAAKKKYNDLGDRDSFVRYLKEERTKVVKIDNFQVKFRGELRDLDFVFYKWMRCNLVHEAQLPEDIEFDGDELSTKVEETKLTLGRKWFDVLATCALSQE